MQMLDAIQFSVSNDKIVCNTPRDGVDLQDFLQTMRRALDAYRNVGIQGTDSPSCTLNVQRSQNVNTGEECTR